MVPGYIWGPIKHNTLLEREIRFFLQESDFLTKNIKKCRFFRIYFMCYSPRNQFAGNRTRVRIPPAAPRRSKRHIACSDFFQKSERAHSAAPPFQIEPAALGFDLVLGADLGANATFSAITNKGCCEIAQQPPFYDTELAYFDSYAGRSILLSGDHFRAEKTLAS